MSMAVVTRNGRLVHWPNSDSRIPAQTLCGREWIDLYTSNVSLSAVSCSVCQRRASASSAGGPA